MLFFIDFIKIIFACLVLTQSISLDTLVCQRQPLLCDPSPRERSLPLTQKSIPPSRNQKGPTIPRQFLHETDQTIPRRPTDFRSWADYGVTHDDGTGYGSGVGPNYGPGKHQNLKQ